MLVLSTGSIYSYGLNRCFDLAARAGFRGVEVLVDQRWDTRQHDYLLRLAADTGVDLASLHSPFVANIHGWPPDPLGRLKATSELARLIGARHVVVHLPFRFGYLWITASWRHDKAVALPVPRGRHDSEYSDFLRKDLAAFEAETGVTIVVENLPRRRLGPLTYNGYQMNTVAEWSRFGHLNLDTTHLATWGLDPLAVYEQVRDRVRHIHLSNFNGKEHRLLWDGTIQLAQVLRRLAADHFDGIVCVELDPEPLMAADESVVLDNLLRTYAFCAEQLGDAA